MICLLVMTHGHDPVIEQTVPEAGRMLKGPVTRRVIHDDTGDAGRRHELSETFPGFEVIGGPGPLGFGGAIRNAWRCLQEIPERYIFHLEHDFLITRSADLAAMADVLDARPHLAQLALLRQPVSRAEQQAGGIIEQHPASYITVEHAGRSWREHRRFFTTNPSLYRGALTGRGWPAGPHSEGMFGLQLFTDPEARCGFWGAEGEWCRHIGVRTGHGY